MEHIGIKLTNDKEYAKIFGKDSINFKTAITVWFKKIQWWWTKFSWYWDTRKLWRKLFQKDEKNGIAKEFENICGSETQFCLWERYIITLSEWILYKVKRKVYKLEYVLKIAFLEKRLIREYSLNMKKILVGNWKTCWGAERLVGDHELFKTCWTEWGWLS